MGKTEHQLNQELKLLKDQVKNMASVNSRAEPGIVTNSALTSRLGLASVISKSHNDTRNLYKVFGYDEKLTLENYIGRYQRQDIAKRIVEAFPKACWSESPSITDDLDTQEETEFEEAVTKLISNKKIKLFHYIQRLDIIAGLGQYGVLFIGIKDGKKTDLPVEGSLRTEDIIFMAPYSEKNVTIAEYDTDPQSERYGLPLMYRLQAGGYGGVGTGSTSQIMKQQIIEVHHSRVIHVADGVLENDVFGTPRLQPVINRLVDLEKIVGGGAETFFLNARGGLHMNQQPDTKIADTSLLETRMEEYTNNLTRYLRTKGIDVNPLNFDVADPKNYFDIIVSLISSATGIPKRILTGSEMGQLASSQDESNFLARVSERQTDYCELQILRPLIDWFIEHNVLPEPTGGEYTIVWEDLNTVSDIEKADVAVKISQAISNYVNAQGAELIMPPEQFFEDVLNLDYREDDLPDAQDFDTVEDGEEI